MTEIPKQHMDAATRVVMIARKNNGSASEKHIKSEYAEWRYGWEDMYPTVEKAIEIAIELGWVLKPMRHGGTKNYSLSEDAP